MPNGARRDLYIDTQEVHLRLKLRVHLSALEKRLGKTLNLRGDSMLHLKILL